MQDNASNERNRNVERGLTSPSYTLNAVTYPNNDCNVCLFYLDQVAAQRILEYTTESLNELAVRRFKVRRNNYKLYGKLTKRYNKLSKAQKELKTVARGDDSFITNSSLDILLNFLAIQVNRVDSFVNYLKVTSTFDRKVLGHSYAQSHHLIKKCKRRINILVSCIVALKYSR